MFVMPASRQVPPVGARGPLLQKVAKIRMKCRRSRKSAKGKKRQSQHPPMELSVTVRTLGFTLAKGLIRGLIRCPNPSKILVYCPFLNMRGIPSSVWLSTCCMRLSPDRSDGRGSRGSALEREGFPCCHTLLHGDPAGEADG